MNKVVETAQRYLNSKELPGNKFVDDPKLKDDIGELIQKAGHKDGEAWCAYFAEAMFCLAYPDKEKQFRKLFSSGAVNTYNQFISAGYKAKMSPTVGDLVVFQHYTKGKPSWQGHIGIVVEVLANGSWISIEGNTTAGGSREGIAVMEKKRSSIRIADGLNLLGFITPV